MIMWLKRVSCIRLFVLFLLVYYNVVPSSATNKAQLKNQYQTITQQQQHSNHVISQPQHQVQQKTLQLGGIATKGVNGMSDSANSAMYDINAEQNNGDAEALTAPLSINLPSSQYVFHDKDVSVQEMLNNFNGGFGVNDPQQMLSEFKMDTYDNTNRGQAPPPPLPLAALNPINVIYPWNTYDRPYAPITLPHYPVPGLMSHELNGFENFLIPFPVAPRYLALANYAQSMFVPYAATMSPDIYPNYAGLSHMANDFQDSMSRAAGTSRSPGFSQPSSSFPRNSPIYYVRSSSTPYIFLPRLDLGSRMFGYPSASPYHSLPPFPTLPSIFNLPINLLANGKPTNIYQMSDPPTDVRNHLEFTNIPSSFSTHPAPPPPNVYRPVKPAHNYFTAQPSSYPASSNGIVSTATASTPTLSRQDSKLTSLKQPYFFNGRPEEIYTLPNNFNTLFPSEISYY